MHLNMKSKLNRDTLISVLFALMAVIIIIPVLIYAGHSFPVADDFHVEIDLAAVIPQCRSYLSAAFIWVYRYYIDIGGYYSDVFFSYLFSPLSRWGLTGLRVVNVSIWIFFFAASFFMIRSFTREILRLKGWPEWFLFFAYILALVNNYANAEIYTWYDVVSEYILVPGIIQIGFGLLCISVSRRNRLYIPAALCAFIGGGAVLNIAVSMCGILFLFGLYMIRYHRKVRESVTVFVTACVGTLVNVISPGNFVRHESYATGHELADAVVHTIKYAAYLLDGKIFHSLFVFIAIAVLAVVYFKVDPDAISGDADGIVKFAHPLLVGCFMVFGILLINYLVHYGYNDASLSFRAIFVCDYTFYILTFMWIVYFTGWLKLRGFILQPSRELWTVTGIAYLLMVITFVTSCGGAEEFTTFRMMKTAANGELREYITYEEAILDEIENSDESDVVIYRPSEIIMPLIKPNWLSDDPGFFMNQWCAEFYGKDTVRVIYTGE